MSKIILSSLAVSLLALLSTPAFAKTVSIPVPYADLKLSSADGLATLDSRIKAAAKRICEPVAVRGPLQNPTRATCVRKVIASAQPQVAAILREHRQLALSGQIEPGK